MKKKLDFESSLEQIESIIEKFEDEVISLDHSIDLYKQGHELIKSCQDKLSSIEQQIKLFNQSTDQLESFNEK